METNNPVEWTVEENFKFQLSQMTDKLLHWASQPNGILYCVWLLWQLLCAFTMGNCSVYLNYHTVDVERFAGLNVHSFNSIEVFTEIFLRYLDYKCLFCSHRKTFVVLLKITKIWPSKSFHTYSMAQKFYMEFNFIVLQLVTEP